MAAARFGRLHRLPAARIEAVVEGLRVRGLADAAGRLTEAGRAMRASIEETTDRLAAPAYDALTAAEIDELTGLLEPVASRLTAAWAGHTP